MNEVGEQPQAYPDVDVIINALVMDAQSERILGHRGGGWMPNYKSRHDALIRAARRLQLGEDADALREEVYRTARDSSSTYDEKESSWMIYHCITDPLLTRSKQS